MIKTGSHLATPQLTAPRPLLPNLPILSSNFLHLVLDYQAPAHHPIIPKATAKTPPPIPTGAAPPVKAVVLGLPNDGLVTVILDWFVTFDGLVVFNGLVKFVLLERGRPTAAHARLENWKIAVFG